MKTPTFVVASPLIPCLSIPHRLVLALLLLLTGIAHGADIQIQVQNRSVQGALNVTLFDSVKAFKESENPVIDKRFNQNQSDSYTIENVAPGSYALIMYIDENNNSQLDTNFVGIPTEPIGYANNYQPKGPPTFRRATIVVEAGKSLTVNPEFRRPLGERGQIGLGLGGIFSSSPYRDFSGDSATLVPVVTYFGDRLRVVGTDVELGLFNIEPISVSALVSYKFRAYEEKESDFLSGMGDRESVFLLGLAAQVDLPLGLNLNTRYGHDVSDKIGGGTAQIELAKSFQIGDIEFTTGAGLNWLASEMSMHNYGVPEQSATSDRTAYTIDDTVSSYVRLGAMVEFSPGWLLLSNVGAEQFDEDITESPIVSEDYVVFGFLAVAYLL